MPQPGHMPPLPPSNFNFDKLKQWLAQQTISVQKLISGEIQAIDIVLGSGGTIESSDFVSGSDGWQIDGDGNAEFNDVTVRGDIVSGNWNGTEPVDLSSSFDGGAGQGFALDSSAGAAQFMGDLWSAGLGLLDPGSGSASRKGELVLDNSNEEVVLESFEHIGITDYSIRIKGSNDVFIEAGGSVNLSDLAPIPGAGGSNSAPGYSFVGDTDTGIYQITGNEIGITTGGTKRIEITSNGISLIDGSTGAPAYSFISDTDTGFYLLNTAQLGVTVAGSIVARFKANAIDFPATGGVLINTPGGTESAPTYSFAGDTNLGIFRAAADVIGFSAGNVRAAQMENGGSGSYLRLRDGLTDVGNHETLRLDRGTGSTMKRVGYFSSWEFDPLTGRRAKKNITPLDRSPKWKREWFDAIRPVTFIRTSTKQREFGFRIEDWVETDDNMKYLTTKGDQWGFSPDDTALLAVTILEVQDLRKRVAALEAA